MGGELAHAYHMVVYRNPEHRGWTFALPQNSGSEMQAYRAAVLCNINNDRRRNLRPRVAPQAHGDEEVTLKVGTVLPPLEEDVITPDAPNWPGSQRPRFRRKSNVSLNSELSGDSAAAPNTQTPKRTRAANKDGEVMKRHCKTYREVATTRQRAIPFDVGEAIDHARTHSPDNEDLYGVGPDVTLPQNDISNDLILANFRAR